MGGAGGKDTEECMRQTCEGIPCKSFDLQTDLP